MRYFRNCSPVLSAVLVAAMLMGALPHRGAFAAMVGTEAVLAGAAGEMDDRDRVRAFLLRGDVRMQIAARGVDPDEAAARVDSLSDAEVAVLAARIGSLPAGQGGGISPTDAAILAVAILAVLAAIIWGFLGLFSDRG